MARDIAGVKVEAHRQKAVLPRELQGIRALADAGDPDWRVWLLVRPDMRAQAFQHQVGLCHLPVFARVVERLLLRPQFQNDVERLARHLAVLPGIAVDIEHRPVARQAAGGNAKIEPPLSHVIEHGDPVRQLGRMVVGQQEAAGGKPDVLRLHQRLRDQQIG